MIPRVRAPVAPSASSGRFLLRNRVIHPRQNIRCNQVKLPSSPFEVVDWKIVEPTEHAGESGSAIWRTVRLGDVRVRLVEYTAGYAADHWCERGHILLMLEGELITELADGRKFRLTPGMSYQVSDSGDAAHRSMSESGAKLFIVD